jgi:hypothetical protein
MTPSLKHDPQPDLKGGYRGVTLSDSVDKTLSVLTQPKKSPHAGAFRKDQYDHQSAVCSFSARIGCENSSAVAFAGTFVKKVRIAAKIISKAEVM